MAESGTEDPTGVNETIIHKDRDVYVKGHGNDVYTINEMPDAGTNRTIALGKGLSVLRGKGVDIDQVIILPSLPESRQSLEVAVLGKPRTQP